MFGELGTAIQALIDQGGQVRADFCASYLVTPTIRGWYTKQLLEVTYFPEATDSPEWYNLDIGCTIDVTQCPLEDVLWVLRRGITLRILRQVAQTTTRNDRTLH